MAKYVPHLVDPIDVSADDCWAFYCNSYAEHRFPELDSADIERLFDFKCGVGQMPGRHGYFQHAYCRLLASAATVIFRASARPRILDICCGTGTQAIFFALLGAEVVGIDFDSGQIALAKKRAAAYADLLGVPLAFEAAVEDVLALDFGTLGTFDAVYSHGGICGLMGAEDVFRRLQVLLKPGGIAVLRAGNPSCLWLSLLGRRPRDSSYPDFLAAARKAGFELRSVLGTSGIPRPLWLGGEAMLAADRLMRRLRPFQINLQYCFVKSPRGDDSSAAAE